MLKHHTRSDLASLLLRLGIAAVFLLHAGLKIAYGPTEWNPNLSKGVQAAVAFGELLIGLACLFGFLSRLAAVGVIVIMAGAIALVTWKSDFIQIDYTRPAGKTEPKAPGLTREAPGYEYNVCLIIMAGALLLLGSGPLSVDRALFRRRARSAAAPTEAQAPASPAPV